MSWREDKITDGQARMIASMMEDAGINGAIIPPFRGRTKGEAHEYIKNNLHAVHMSAHNGNEDAGDRV